MDPVAPDDVRGEGAGFRQGEIAVPAGGDRVAVESPADVSGVGGVADAERDFRVIAENDPPLKGSFFDLMTEVRTTPENASESLRDFLDRSLKML